MPISTRTRFEIFKRDGFACQYCGRTRDDGVKLHVDHIVATANGGTDDPLNLITACQDCNLGKSAVPLNVRKIPDARHEAVRLEALAHVEENKLRLALIAEQGYDVAIERWESWWRGRPTYPYPNSIKAWIRDYGIDEVLNAIDKSCDKCDDSLNAVKYLAGIFRNKKSAASEDSGVAAAVRDEFDTICISCDVALKPGEEFMCEPCDRAVQEDIRRSDEEEMIASVLADDEIALEVKAWDELAEAAGF